MAKPPGTRGRPPAASRELLQEAAFELFLENSYAGTTVEQITQRAGVSRNTFFNYFPSKADVFWVELDEAVGRLSEHLAASAASAPALEVVLEGVLAVGQQFGPSRVPFALTQYELIGSVHELQASALTRFTSQAGIIADFLAAHGVDALPSRAAAYGVLGAAIAAAQVWAAAGTTRGELEPYLREAVEPVVEGFAAHSAADR